MLESTLPAAAEDPVFTMHRGGKISVRPSVDVTDRQGLAMAYTPGVARVCTAIAEQPDLAAEYTGCPTRSPSSPTARPCSASATSAPPPRCP